MQSRTVIYMGPQGSGKGTQVRALQEYFNAQEEGHSLFQTGEMFRTLQQKNSFVAHKVQGTLDKGTHQPLALSVALWGHVFIKYSTPEKHHILDGFPRRLEEAKLLNEMLEFCERMPVDVIFLDIDDETAISRLKGRNRADDTDAGIKKRMEFYKEHTAPIVPYYKAHDAYRFHTIDATTEPEDVTKSVFAALSLT